MSKQIAQFRYYGEGSNRNSPSDLSMRRLTSGSIFTGKLPITQLGIQTLPGVKFYLNNGTSPIMVGGTGVYELNLEGSSQITAISFAADSLNLINENLDTYVIIDFIYEKED